MSAVLRAPTGLTTPTRRKATTTRTDLRTLPVTRLPLTWTPAAPRADPEVRLASRAVRARQGSREPVQVVAPSCRASHAAVKVAARAFRASHAAVKVAARAFRASHARVKVAARAFRASHARVKVVARAFRVSHAVVKVVARAFRASRGLAKAEVACRVFRGPGQAGQAGQAAANPEIAWQSAPRPAAVSGGLGAGAALLSREALRTKPTPCYRRYFRGMPVLARRVCRSTPSAVSTTLAPWAVSSITARSV